MKIAICDDEKFFRDQLYRNIISFKDLPTDTSIDMFSNGNELIEYYDANYHEFDIVFLDMEMPRLSGLETGQKIRERDKDVFIIYVTIHEQYAIPAMKITVFDYILKPVTNSKTNSVLTRVINKYQEQRNLITLEYPAGTHILYVKDVIYVEVHKRRLTFYTENKEYECYGRLNEYETKLAPYGFLKCHKNLLINMKYIKSIEAMHIITTTGVELDISVRRRKELIKAFNLYVKRSRLL